MTCCDPCADLASIKSDLAELKAKMTLLLQHCGPQTPPPPPGGFAVDAATFDGLSDWLSRGAALSGVADSATAILSYWIRSAAASGYVLASDAEQVGEFISSMSGPFFYDSGGVNGIFASGTTALDDGDWHHVLIALNSSGTVLEIYVDDVSDGGAPSVDGTPANFFFSDTDWGIGASPSGGSKLAADLAEVYFAPGQFLDITVEANRRKFISAAGKPVDLGADGSTPTGAAPAVYLHLDDGEAVANFAVNAGTGGNFTVNGALATAATSPSD
jgi:hypothetical protein